MIFEKWIYSGNFFISAVSRIYFISCITVRLLFSRVVEFSFRNEPVKMSRWVKQVGKQENHYFF
jgi:hypothetical protein